MSDVKTTRSYRSPLRQAQAEATRRRVMAAALRLFGERGYASTAIAGIAAEAGVAPETIYAAFGSKRGILEGLVDGVLAQGAGQAARSSFLAHAGDPAAQLGVLADTARNFWETNRALVGVFRQGTGDSELAELWSARQRDRRQLFRALLASWPAGTLAHDLDLDHAMDLTFALTSADLFHLLVEESGWSTDVYRDRLADLLRSSLLGTAR